MAMSVYQRVTNGIFMEYEWTRICEIDEILIWNINGCVLESNPAGGNVECHHLATHQWPVVPGGTAPSCTWHG